MGSLLSAIRCPNPPPLPPSGHLDERRYEHAARSLDETGRLVGGWRKADELHFAPHDGASPPGGRCDRRPRRRSPGGPARRGAGQDGWRPSRRSGIWDIMSRANAARGDAPVVTDFQPPRRRYAVDIGHADHRPRQSNRGAGGVKFPGANRRAATARPGANSRAAPRGGGSPRRWRCGCRARTARRPRAQVYARHRDPPHGWSTGPSPPTRRRARCVPSSSFRCRRGLPSLRSVRPRRDDHHTEGYHFSLPLPLPLPAIGASLTRSTRVGTYRTGSEVVCR